VGGEGDRAAEDQGVALADLQALQRQQAEADGGQARPQHRPPPGGLAQQQPGEQGREHHR
jgi:hypothetical protein